MTRLLLLFGLLCACPRQLIIPTDPEVAFNEAKRAFDSGRYDEAVKRFQHLSLNFPGSRFAPDAQFYLAESYLLKKDYGRALTEYDFFIKNFPSSPYYPEACYKLGLAHLRSAPPYYKDQVQTQKARELLEEFLHRFPDSPLAPQARTALKEADDRLARKEFEAARLYLRYGELNSALRYLEYLKSQFPDFEWTFKLKFLVAEHYRRSGVEIKARGLYEEILRAESAPSRLKGLARDRLEWLEAR